MELPKGWTARSKLMPDAERETRRIRKELEGMVKRAGAKVLRTRGVNEIENIKIDWNDTLVAKELSRWREKNKDAVEESEVVTALEGTEGLVRSPIDKYTGDAVLT